MFPRVDVSALFIHKLLQMGFWGSVDHMMKIILSCLIFQSLCDCRKLLLFRFFFWLLHNGEILFPTFSLKGFIYIAPDIFPSLQGRRMNLAASFLKPFITLANSWRESTIFLSHSNACCSKTSFHIPRRKELLTPRNKTQPRNLRFCPKTSREDADAGSLEPKASRNKSGFELVDLKGRCKTVLLGPISR